MTNASSATIPIHGGQLRQIAARLGVATEDLLDFSANINPAGPPPSVLAAIQNSLTDPATLVAYPDLESTALKLAIATYLTTQPTHLSVANGFVPLLDAALRSLRITRCLLPVPSFSEYRRTLENSDISVIPLPLSSDENFCYQPDEIAKQCLENACDAILLANPQNPSSVVSSSNNMRLLIEAVATQNVNILLDEAFIDYCPENSLAQLACEHPQMIVFRSITKFFAIPGLRVAYAISRNSVVQTMNQVLPPWPITSIASAGACAALHDQTYADVSRRTNQRRRNRLRQQLANLKIETYPASANFLLLRFAQDINVGQLWQKMIVEQGIVLRSCANFEGLSPQHLRVAVRSEPDNDALIQGLQQVLPEHNHGRYNI